MMSDVFCRCREVSELLEAEARDYVEHLVKITIFRAGKWEVAYECPLLAYTWVSDPIPGPVPDGPRYRLRRLPPP